MLKPILLSTHRFSKSLHWLAVLMKVETLCDVWSRSPCLLTCIRSIHRDPRVPMTRCRYPHSGGGQCGQGIDISCSLGSLAGTLRCFALLSLVKWITPVKLDICVYSWEQEGEPVSETGCVMASCLLFHLITWTDRWLLTLGYQAYLLYKRIYGVSVMLFF